MQAFSSSAFDLPLRSDVDPNVPIMTGLQIAMSREIGGWPLYTIVIALGQVNFPPLRVYFNTHDYPRC
jgi:alpha-1,3-glucan synthase